MRSLVPEQASSSIILPTRVANHRARFGLVWNIIGHILRQDRNNNNIAISWAPEGKRKRGKPETTWRRTVDKERKTEGWRSWEKTRMITADREK